MSFAHDLNRIETGLVDRMRTAFGEKREAFLRFRRYRDTMNELNNLSTHELDDLGINRGEITSIARTAAYGK